MTHFFRFTVVAFAFLLPAAAAAQGAPQGDAKTGQALFNSKGCYECHGYEGQGDIAGPRLNPPPPYPVFVTQLRTPRDVMPPFSAKLVSEQQAIDIYAFLQMLPKPPDPKTIPLLENN